MKALGWSALAAAIMILVVWWAMREKSSMPSNPSIAEKERERIRREIKADSDCGIVVVFLDAIWNVRGKGRKHHR